MLTQDDYKLYTSKTTNFTDTEWQKLVDIASIRLARFLCLDKISAESEGGLPTDLTMLLANFLCLMLEFRGENLQVTSKRVRNFTINYSDTEARSIFVKLSQSYGDIIDKYSNCGTGIAVEIDAKRCCNGYL